MDGKTLARLLFGFLIATSVVAFGAVITENDSTQPRGAPSGVNDRGQVLDPINEGFRSPAQIINPVGSDNFYREWTGSIMAYSVRDPSFFATLNVANQDIIDFINSMPGEPGDASTTLGIFLKNNKLDNDIYRDEDGSLQPEKLLPVAADVCLRCHAPGGWLEAHSEPATLASPFLKGQFWGAAILEEPVDIGGNPRPVD